MSAGTRRERAGTQALGLVFLLLLAALGWLTVAIYNKTFSAAVPVYLRTDRVGNQLQANSDVKVRGVLVGSVREVRVLGAGAQVELAIEPEKLDQLPRNVSARLLPKSVFGQRFVNLVIPEQPDGTLAEGDVIVQDSSAVAIELEKVLNDLMPLLQAVQPQKLAASLGSAAQALDGRGEQLGGTLVELDRYLTALNPYLPKLQRDIAKFADLADTYNEAGPDIIDALADTATTTNTIAERQQDVREFLLTVTAAADDLDGFLRPNKQTLVALAAEARPILRLLAEHSGSFPCLFAAVNDLKPLVAKALGAGSNEPGLHLELKVKERSGGAAAGVGARC
ncbi:MAG: MCE family protein [Thermocrispum sp.]